PSTRRARSGAGSAPALRRAWRPTAGRGRSSRRARGEVIPRPGRVDSGRPRRRRTRGEAPVLHIFVPDIPITEKVLRSVVVNVVQNALIGNDNSLGGGLVGAAAILALNTVVVEVTYHSRRARRLLEAQPTLLIHDGRLLEDNMRRERVTLNDLLAALRRNGVIDPAQVRVAMLEEHGGISVTRR